MITVEQALSSLLALVDPLDAEEVDLADAGGRVLIRSAQATRAQPPFAASAMDGYALRASEARAGATFTVIGESAAGHRFDGKIAAGQAARIFTGAPVPQGADRIIIQEDVQRDGDTITLNQNLDSSFYLRPAGGDFAEGTKLEAPCRLGPSEVALLAAMNVARVHVTRRPEVAIMATGDELVMPGENPGPDQIIASNSFGLKVLVESIGANARLLPIARDTAASLETAFGLARGADLIVTIGGASEGDHDLVGQVAADLGMDRAFYKVAMRPGKPIMAGRLEGAALCGLPGNPVSALVCGQVFLIPMIRKMLGLGGAAMTRQSAPLSINVGANGPREHYMRARLDGAGIAPFERQDSSLLTVLSAANALLIRAPHDGPRNAGDLVEYIPL